MPKQVYRRLLSIHFLVLLLCLAFAGRAQYKDSLLSLYNSQTIHTYGTAFVKGSKQLKFGDLEREFTSPLTIDLYKKAKSDRFLGRLFTVTSVAALATSTVLRFNGTKNKGSALAFSIAGIALNLGSYPFKKQSHELIGRALWLRNRDVLFGPQ